MPSLIVVGTQWGDEGKGKIVDVLANEMDLVVRAQGGHNAGHTVLVDGQEYKLHLIPSGVLSQKVHCYIGPGVVVDPRVLIQEIDMLKKRGIDLQGRLHLSSSAHLILPYHQLLDALVEKKKKGGAIGTTLSGIGPAYADQINRVGLRVGDLLNLDRFEQKLRENVKAYSLLFEKMFEERAPSYSDLFEDFQSYAEALEPYIIDKWPINEKLAQGKRVLLEGAQGTYLDINHGTYPFVTSSNTVASGICTGAGLGPTAIDEVLGIAKAYTTRVGAGPLPTYFESVEGFPLQEEARELGTTTGRLRRMGWLDLVMLRQAVEINGITSLALTKLDVLDKVKKIKVCTGYQRGSEKIDYFPSDTSLFDEIKPIYEELPGWEKETSTARAYEELPKSTRDYIEKIESFCRCRVSILSVGPARAQTFRRES